MSSINYEMRGASDGFPIVFGHGWGRDHQDFMPAAELLGDTAKIIMVDFPGFGKSAPPASAWNTQDYAQATKAFLENELGIKRFLWVGHSFGGRVGLRLAQIADCPVEHLFIIAGAGVKPPAPVAKRIRRKWRGWNFKRRKTCAQNEEEIIALEKEFGSQDYIDSRKTGMREIFIRTVEEDQSEFVASISCPTTLLYGSRDTETPPDVGKLLNALIPHSIYLECPEFDHHSILSRGRHQMTLLLRDALESVKS